MTGGRTFAVDGWTIARAVEAKAGRTASMCIPCGDEATTIARQAGVTLVPITDVHEIRGVGAGKGNALWATLVASTGDVVVWRDGDVTSSRSSWVTHLLAPLLADDAVAFDKAPYERVGGGGRTAELVARPLLSLYAPALTAVAQPLAGRGGRPARRARAAAVRQRVGRRDRHARRRRRTRGAGSITPVDLGVRRHRHRDLADLTVQAAEVAAALLTRVPGAPTLPHRPTLARVDGTVVTLDLTERPPVATVSPSAVRGPDG